MNSFIAKIQQGETCPHKILPEDCSTCQMDAFQSNGNEFSNLLPKDLKHLLNDEVVQSAKKVFTFDFRFASEDELGYEDEFTEEFPDLCHGLFPVDSEHHDGKKIRIVFVGEEEGCLGFLFGLVYRFGALTIMTGELDIGPSPLNAKLIHRYANDINGSCAFNQCPGSKYRMLAELSPEEGMAYFATTNIEQFYSGFKKILSLEIEGVYPREFVEYKVQKKHENHSSECEFCEEDMVEDVEIEEVPLCKVYWYFIE